MDLMKVRLIDRGFLANPLTHTGSLLVELVAFVFAFMFFENVIMQVVASTAIAVYIVLVFELLFHKVAPESIMVRYNIKIIAASSVVIASAYFYPDNTLIFLPMIIFLMLVFFNIIVGKDEVLEKILGVYIIATTAMVLMKLDFTDDVKKSAIVLIQYVILGAVTLILSRIHLNKYNSDEFKIEVERYKNDVEQAAKRLFRHDMKNILLKTQMIKQDIETGNSADALQMCDDILFEGYERANSIDFSYKFHARLRTIAAKACTVLQQSNPGIKIDIDLDIPKDVVVMINDNYLISVLVNLLNNSAEAFYRKRGDDLDSVLEVKIYYCSKNGVLEVTDNAGGFDVSKISPGYSEKPGTGHGVFLYSFLKDQKLFGLKSIFKNIGNGTQVHLHFLEETSKYATVIK